MIYKFRNRNDTAEQFLDNAFPGTKAGVGWTRERILLAALAYWRKLFRRYGDRRTGAIIIPRLGLEVRFLVRRRPHGRWFFFSFGNYGRWVLAYVKNRKYEGETYGNMQSLVCARAVSKLWLLQLRFFSWARGKPWFVGGL